MAVERVLLVQCCHPPNFLYVLKQLREVHPNWQFDVFLVDHPDSRAALEKFPVSGSASYFPASPPSEDSSYDKVIFPLLNWGYARLKRSAWRLPWPAWKINYQGRLAPLNALSLWSSLLRPPRTTPAAFPLFLERFFPTRALGLVIQSDDSARMRQVLKTLHERRPMADSSIAVFCRGEDRSLFASAPGVEKIFTYRPGQWRQNLRVAQRLRRLRASVVVTHLSGKPTFRLHKLLFFLIPAGRRLAVNENLDCFYAGRSALVRFFLWRVAHPTRPPLVPMTTQSRVLLIQTEDPRTMVSTLDVLLEPHIAPRARVTVYCREDARKILGAHAAVHRILTYGPGGFRKKLTSLWDAVRSHPDIVAAAFSRRPIFLLHRILFLLLPARSRLVFNENIDCYFLNRATLAQLFRRREKETRIRFVVRTTLIPLIRKLLFLPRFSYLLGWLGLQQLSRHYRMRHRR